MPREARGTLWQEDGSSAGEETGEKHWACPCDALLPARPRLPVPEVSLPEDEAFKYESMRAILVHVAIVMEVGPSTQDCYKEFLLWFLLLLVCVVFVFWGAWGRDKVHPSLPSMTQWLSCHHQTFEKVLAIILALSWCLCLSFMSPLQDCLSPSPSINLLQKICCMV